MDRSSRQKINKDVINLNATLDQMNLTDIYRTFHSAAAEYTFFSSTYGTFSRKDDKIGHKTSLSKFKTTDIIRGITSNHNGLKLEISNRRKLENSQLCRN